VRRRLLLSYLSLTVFVLLALELPLGLSFANAEKRRLTGQVQTEAFALAVRVDEALSTPGPAADAVLATLMHSFRDQTRLSAVVVNGGGAVVAATGRDEPRPGGMLGTRLEVAAALKGRQATRERTAAGHDVVSVAVPVLAAGSTVGAVRVTSSLDVVAERTSSHWLLLGGLGGVIALVVLLVSVLLARSFTRPLAALDAGAARLGDGDLGARVPVPDDPPELRGLACSFNSTAERLETLVRSQQTFVADASHQLRTPLAALSLRLENLEAEEPDFRVEDLDGALTEVRRLARLVDGLLVLARAEDAPAATATVGLREVVERRLDAWSAVAGERGIDLDADVDDLGVRSAPGRLEQVLDNLLSNALDVAPAGTVARVDAQARGDRVRVEVSDRGPGMTAEQRARAFDRFWRADPTRKHEGGFGLGLAIVQRLVRADGGDISLDEATGGGLVVVLDLPAARLPAPVAVPV
jgi:signal transduction histidine kinase